MIRKDKGKYSLKMDKSKDQSGVLDLTIFLLLISQKILPNKIKIKIKFKLNNHYLIKILNMMKASKIFWENLGINYLIMKNIVFMME
jgi:hypothetical protein